MEGFKLNLFSDEIFVFTPKGVVLSLPAGATPIDFAYKIHTDIGNRCIGAKANGKMVTLDYKLKTGDIVEILTTSSPKGPSMDWLGIAKSNQARSKIKQWFKKAKREENIEKGKDFIEKECKRQSINFADICKGERYEKLCKKYHLNSLDDLYATVGEGVVTASIVLLKLRGELYNQDRIQQNEKVNKDIEEQISKTERSTANNKTMNNGVTVKGLSNIMVRFARCCNPVPGDEIVGYVTKGRGISIHRKDCSNFKNIIEKQYQKVVEVSWGKAKGAAYVAELQVEAEDKLGLLSEVMVIITQANLPLVSLNAKTDKNNTANINIQVKIDSVEQLKTLMKRIKNLKGILDVYRVNN